MAIPWLDSLVLICKDQQVTGFMLWQVIWIFFLKKLHGTKNSFGDMVTHKYCRNKN